MRPALRKLRPALEAETAAARETAAAALYELEKVRAAIYAAAGAGHGAWRIAAPDGLNLSDTLAVRALMAWLSEEKLDFSWERRSTATTDGRRVDVQDLVIRWRIELGN